jgi:hypothetical protein
MIDAPERDMLNIKDLLIPDARRDQEQPLFFDPEKEIDELNWQDMKRQLLAYEGGGKWNHFAETAGSVAILLPSKREELRLDSDVKDRVMDALRFENKDPLSVFMDNVNRPRAAMLQALFPESNVADELGYDNERVLAIIRDGLGRDYSLLYDRMIFDTLILFPGITPELVSHPRLKETLEREAMSDMNAFSPYNAAALKLLYPQARKEIFSSKINELRKEYEETKGKIFWRTALQTMLPLAVLSSGKAEVISHGIKLSQEKEAAGFVQTQTTLPEVRKY